MDPLSITASIIAVVGAAKATSKGLRKLYKFSSANREIDALIKELDTIIALLQETTELVKSSKTEPTREKVLVEPVARLLYQIEEINDLLTLPRRKIPGVSEQKQAQISWVKHENKIKALRRDLVDMKMDVLHALGILTASFTSDVGKSLITSIGLQNDQSDKITAIFEKLTVIEEVARGPRQLEGSQPPNSQSSLPAIEPPHTPILHDQDKDEHTKSDAVTTISRRSSMTASAGSEDDECCLPTPKKCPSWCSCCCHSKKTYILPRFLANIVGATVIEYVSDKTKCNEYSCQRSRKAVLNLSYGLPSYLSHQYLLLSMSRAPLGNPKFSINMPRTMDWTHLLWHYAPRGDLPAIKGLFSCKKAAPDDINFQGETALHYAAFHPKLYHFLIKVGADWSVTNNQGRRPVDLIGQRLLVGALPAEDAFTTREHIVETDFMESRQFTTIHKIVLDLKCRDLRKELENSTADLNVVCTLGRTPLIWATMRDDIAAANVLLSFGADVNIRDHEGNSALHYVKSTDLCTDLLKGGADIKARNLTHKQTCVHTICKTIDNPELIGLLHESGADIDAREADDETPLMNAIYSRFTHTVEKLIGLGANLNAKNHSSKEAPIHFAVSFDHHEIIPVLIERGADYTAVNRYGSTIAHIAAGYSISETVEVLARLSLVELDLSNKDDDGKTPADRLAAREVLLEAEAGIHESFARFTDSIAEAKAQQVLQRRQSEGIDSGEKGEDMHLPGAYPSAD